MQVQQTNQEKVLFQIDIKITVKINKQVDETL